MNWGEEENGDYLKQDEFDEPNLEEWKRGEEVEEEERESTI